jgi:hypothetical protein
MLAQGCNQVLSALLDSRCGVQEKTIVTTALQKSKHRAALNFTLAEKLNKLIGEEHNCKFVRLKHAQSDVIQ